MPDTYRLVTRSDFDGLVCAALLKELGILDEVKFVHPKDMQDGKVEISDRDITTNLPFVESAHLAFDHHASESDRIGNGKPNHVIDPTADSTARVVYEYFGGGRRFHTISREMLEAVDKADSARFSKEEILNPGGWVLMSYLMDPRTGLGRFRDFRISNYQLMLQLIDDCTKLPVETILASPDVRERVQLYKAHEDAAIDQIQRCSAVHHDLVVLDLRGEKVIHPTNRFMIYALHTDQRISMHVLWGLKQQNTVFAVGKSILDRTKRLDVGSLMLEYGGGGHTAAGTCQIDNDRADQVQDELVGRITQAA